MVYGEWEEVCDCDAVKERRKDTIAVAWRRDARRRRTGWLHLRRWSRLCQLVRGSVRTRRRRDRVNQLNESESLQGSRDFCGVLHRELDEEPVRFPF